MTTVAETSPETERKVPLVPPASVWQNKAGSRFCQWDAVAPEGASFNDVLEPSAWKRVQETKKPALRQNDELRITAFDRSWTVWCIVDHATGNGLVLSLFADTQRAGPQEHLAEDDLYAVRFTGAGYAVHRKSDDQRIGDVWPSAARAATALRELYPKVVS